MHSTPPHCSKPAQPLSIQGALQRAAQLLARASSDSPQQEAHILLQTVTRQSLTQVMCSLQRILTTDEAKLLEECLQRRLAREPLQYILGHATFRGCHIHLNHHVLIPRPETELLIDVAHDVLDHATTRVQVPLIIDVGTGSGAVAVSLACELPHARVVAIDTSAQALQVARTNICANHADDRVALIRGDLVSMIGGNTDVVVANLPYIPTDELSHLAPEISQHEPLVALDGGPDGLRLQRRICEEAIHVLKPGGWLLVEIGHSQSHPVTHMLSGVHWDRVDIVRDLSGIPRVIAARSRDPQR